MFLLLIEEHNIRFNAIEVLLDLLMCVWRCAQSRTFYTFLIQVCFSEGYITYVIIKSPYLLVLEIYSHTIIPLAFEFRELHLKYH